MKFTVSKCVTITRSKRFGERAYDLIRNAICELQQSGIIPKFRDSFLTFMWTGMVFWTVYWFDYSRQDNSEELAEVIVKTFEGSMCGKIFE